MHRGKTCALAGCALFHGENGAAVIVADHRNVEPAALLQELDAPCPRRGWTGRSVEAKRGVTFTASPASGTPRSGRDYDGRDDERPRHLAIHQIGPGHPIHAVDTASPARTGAVVQKIMCTQSLT